MKRFYCECGNELFFENHFCHSCGNTLGFDPQSRNLLSLKTTPGRDQLVNSNSQYFRLCANRTQYGLCNFLIAATDNHAFCISCRLNRTIPDISRTINLNRLKSIEQAKRRLIYDLLVLSLPLNAPVKGFSKGLKFDFLEDKRSNIKVADEYVTTGHANGVITLNVLEADDTQRTWQQEQSNERYRTVLGHFRHEVGHYYYELLAYNKAGFIQLFSDPDQPYHPALKSYYAHGALDGWKNDFISAYASSHPLEDWAETFAHYLHIQDTLETAMFREVIPSIPPDNDFDQSLLAWDTLSVTLNELNRSLGLPDAYPFVITPVIGSKLKFIHQAVRSLGLIT